MHDASIPVYFQNKENNSVLISYHIPLLHQRWSGESSGENQAYGYSSSIVIKKLKQCQSCWEKLPEAKHHQPARCLFLVLHSSNLKFCGTEPATLTVWSIFLKVQVFYSEMVILARD